MITAFNCHNSAGIWSNVGVLSHFNCSGCQPNPSPRLPLRQPSVGSHCCNVAAGQTRGGASPYRLVPPAVQALLEHAVGFCLSVFARTKTWCPKLRWIKCWVSFRPVIRFKAQVFWQVSWWQLQDVSWKCEPMSVASAVSVAVLHAIATAGGEWHRVYVQRECVPACLFIPNAFSLRL